MGPRGPDAHTHYHQRSVRGVLCCHPDPSPENAASPTLEKNREKRNKHRGQKTPRIIFPSSLKYFCKLFKLFPFVYFLHFSILF